MDAIEKGVERIEKELARLGACDSETKKSGIRVYSEGELPRGWVRLSDGTGTAYGDAEEIAAVLAAVDYDREATVEEQCRPEPCYDPDCPEWRGHQPTAGSPYSHGHEQRETVQRDNGWELAWESLGELKDRAPTDSQDWPAELISYEQLEEGTCNDNPNTLITVETNGGTRYAAGPHGANYCALSDWLGSLDQLAETRDEAIEKGVEINEADKEIGD